MKLMINPEMTKNVDVIVAYGKFRKHFRQQSKIQKNGRIKKSMKFPKNSLTVRWSSLFKISSINTGIRYIGIMDHSGHFFVFS